MEGFKIKNPNEIKTQYMDAKCVKTKNDFVIRLEKENNVWYMVYAFKNDIRNGNTEATIYKNANIDLSKGLSVGNQYKCPDCGVADIVQCGKCKKISCWNGGKSFTCAYCGVSGEVNGIINSVKATNYKQEGKKSEV